MALSQSLSTGVTGLMSHQKAMDNLGNNLANINTVGYKKGVYQFATLLEQSLRGGMGAAGGRGSINPIAMGMGAQTCSINKVFRQGSLEPTDNFNDMAIFGNGFFVVSTGQGYAYTRDGSFYVDEDGYLMGGNGYYIQGTQAVKNADGSWSVPQDSKLQNLVIPLNSTGGMSKTSKVSFAGNLDSTQPVSSGLRLFGSKAPTVSDAQSWMPKPNTPADATWKTLEDESYVVSQEMLELAARSGLSVPGGVSGQVTAYKAGKAPDPATQSSFHAINTATGKVEEVFTTDANGNRVPANVGTLIAAGYIPVTEEIGIINGGNVQTSAAFGIAVPDYLTMGSVVEHGGKKYTVNNEYTYPPWFYESNGGGFTSVVGLDNTAFLANPGAGWPNGFQGTAANPTTVPSSLNDLPRTGENYPATLDTPLEHLWYWAGNRWTQPFAGVKDGDEIAVTFDKGESRMEATFVYNRPGIPQPSGNQQKIDIERSYTLEHFLKFMAGDVDKAGSAGARITPSMFGAPVTAEFPDGDMTSPSFDAKSYNDALANYNLAKSDNNLNLTGGVMGLIDLPPNISGANDGGDSCDSPIETAGAFTREGVSQVGYQRWNSALQQMETYTADSFNISLVSNLGSENALENISFTFKDVSHKTMFSDEKKYSAPQGGSATANVVFYDSLGNPKNATLRMSLVHEDSNFTTWRWYADCDVDTDFPWQVDPNTGEIISNLNVGAGIIRFDTDGNFVMGSEFSESGGIVINQATQGVDDPIQIKIVNGQNSRDKQDLDFSALTFNSRKNNLSLSKQDGSAPGTLDSYEVAADGTIMGVYSTGATIPLGRIVLATVPNPNGLVAGGGNLYYTSPASGDAQYGYPELGGKGAIRQYNLESSNVEMSDEFTRLISIERGFQANSRIITTADEMLQELLQMVR